MDIIKGINNILRVEAKYWGEKAAEELEVLTRCAQKVADELGVAARVNFAARFNVGFLEEDLPKDEPDEDEIKRRVVRVMSQYYYPRYGKDLSGQERIKVNWYYDSISVLVEVPDQIVVEPDVEISVRPEDKKKLADVFCFELESCLKFSYYLKLYGVEIL